MATNFRYCDVPVLTRYVNRISDYDKKRQLYSPTTSSNLHTFQDTGFVDVLFVNGAEQGSQAGSQPSSNNQWRYLEATNKVEYYNDGYSSTTVNEQVFEAGEDFQG